MTTDGPEDDPCEAPAAVLDLCIFEELRESFVSLPEELAAAYRTFLANATGFIEMLRRESGAAVRVATLHKLKGSAAMLGANRIAVLAARLQEDFPAASVSVAKAIGELMSELETFRGVVELHLARCGCSLQH